MRLDEPSWWYPQTPSRVATFLQPLGALYGWAAATRYFRATPYRSRLPIICIGNFTAGGTGKTPLAVYLCERLKAAGHEPVALTRGYGGRLSGPYWVNGRSDVARDVGDEALLLAKAAPTLVARDRRIGARAIEIGPHPVTVVVMDDGLQNPALAKDLTIAVVDGGRCAPSAISTISIATGTSSSARRRRCDRSGSPTASRLSPTRARAAL